MLQPIKNLLANKPILSVLSISACAFLMLFPGSATPDNVPEIPFLDKFFHIALFGACAFSIYFDFIVKKKLRPIVPVLVFTIVLLIAGGIIEVLQELFLNRTGSADDIIADFIGVVVGFIVASISAQHLYKWVNVRIS